MSTLLRLPAELTIYTVAATREAWLAALAAPDAETLRADAAGVGEIDAAGLQLLVALRRSLAERGRALHLCDPSESLRAACRRAGLTTVLEASRDA